MLLVAAYFHMTGFGPMKTAIAPLEPGFYKTGLPVMWVLPSVHWGFIACVSVGLARYKSQACAAILMAFGVWVLVDAAITFTQVGAFMGVYMLGLAGLLLLLSGLMLRKDARS